MWEEKGNEDDNTFQALVLCIALKKNDPRFSTSFF